MSQFNEPWVLGEEHESMCRIESADGKIVAVANGGSGIRLPNTPDCAPHDIANRIVACVNACQHLSDDMLKLTETGMFKLFVAQADKPMNIVVGVGEGAARLVCSSSGVTR